MKKKIYFDHAATTPVDPSVQKAMLPYFSDRFGNAASIHNFGQKAMAAVDQSRAAIAKFLGCKSNEVIFTAGATESDNIAIQGLVKSGEHIITSKIEHLAVLETCGEMEKRGVNITYLEVTKNGLVEVESVRKAIRPNTRLVSVMYVNNEIGTIQPIVEIGQLIQAVNAERKKQNLRQIYFHTDAVQAALYCDMNVVDLQVDLLSLSGHKIYGPKGIGILYRKIGTPVLPIQFGGHQEFGLRPGTLNVAGIVGLGQAVELLSSKKNLESEIKKIKRFRDNLIAGIKKSIPKAQLNGDQNKRTAANVHFSFYGVEGESLLLLLDQAGLAVSTGSACSSGSLEPSHVLLALDLDPLLSHGSLRITLGKDNTQSEVNYFLSVLPKIITKLRKISPLK